MLRPFQYIMTLLLLVVAQVFLFENINIAGYVSPTIYIMFILLMPLEINSALLLLIGFGIGATIDFFTGNMGLCAMCATLIAYLRPWLLKRLIGTQDIRLGGTPSPKTMGRPKFTIYISTLTLIYTASYILLERMTMLHFGHTLLRIVLSTTVSVMVIYLSYLMINRKETTRWQ